MIREGIAWDLAWVAVLAAAAAAHRAHVPRTRVLAAVALVAMGLAVVNAAPSIVGLAPDRLGLATFGVACLLAARPGASQSAGIVAAGAGALAALDGRAGSTIVVVVATVGVAWLVGIRLPVRLAPALPLAAPVLAVALRGAPVAGSAVASVGLAAAAVVALSPIVRRRLVDPGAGALALWGGALVLAPLPAVAAAAVFPAAGSLLAPVAGSRVALATSAPGLVLVVGQLADVRAVPGQGPWRAAVGALLVAAVLLWPRGGRAPEGVAGVAAVVVAVGAVLRPEAWDFTGPLGATGRLDRVVAVMGAAALVTWTMSAVRVARVPDGTAAPPPR